MKFSTIATDSMPERKEVTERIERMKQEQAVRDRQLQEQQSSRPPQQSATVRQTS